MQINNGKGNMAGKKDMELRALIKKNMEMFKMALPKIITVERMVRIAMTAVTMNPKLATCSQSSFFGALLTAAQLGLEVNTPIGQAYLIPYNSKTGLKCQFQIGYQGILELAYRSGKFKRIKAVVVHKGDDFRYTQGINPTLEHTPQDSGEPTHVYALYELLNGGYDFEVWTWERAMRHGKTYSKSFDESPWETNPEEMGKKTVLKSVLKYAPKAVELADAITVDEGVINKKFVVEDGNNEIINDINFDDDEIGVSETKKTLVSGVKESSLSKTEATKDISKEQEIINTSQNDVLEFPM